MTRKLVLAVMLAACGSDPTISLADYPSANLAASCQYLVKCGLFTDEASCVAFTPLPADSNAADAVAANKMSYSGTSAKQCIDSIAAASCDSTQQSAREIPNACTHIFTGKLATGDTCAFDLECQSGACDIPSCGMACCTGTCAPAVAKAQVGASCATADCVEGAFCDATQTCRALLAQGSSCSDPSDCAYGLGCVGLSPGTAGTCGPMPAIGQPCPDGFCRDIGAVCNPSGTCVAAGLTGAPCTADFDCSSYYHCDTQTMMCAPYPTLGMPCTALCSDGTWCQIPTGQSMGTCTAGKPNGQPCSAPTQCESRYCDPSTSQCSDVPTCN